MSVESGERPSRPGGWWGLLLLATILFTFRLGARDLWEPDEPNFAQTAREMMESHDYVLPTLNGHPEGEKPPMFYWCVAACSKLAGNDVSELTARLPSAAGMLLTVMAVGFAAARCFGYRAGLLAGCVLATCHRAIWEARVGQVDALNCLFVTLTFLWFLRASEHEPPSRIRLAAGYGFCGLAILTKGHPGFICALATLFIHGLLLKRPRPVARLGLEVGLPICVAFGLIWLLPLLREAPSDFLWNVLYRQTLVRYFTPWHHQQPFYYYLLTAPPDFLPWTVFLPGALALAWRRGWVEREPTRLYLLIWPAIVFLYFSLSSAKRSIYVLPAFPALAMLVGSFLDTALDDLKRWESWLAVPIGIWAGLVAVLGVAAPIAITHSYRLMTTTAMWLAPLLLTGALVIAAPLRKGRTGEALGATIAVTATFFLYLHSVMLPAFNPYNSARDFCDHLLRTSRPGEQAVCYGFYRGAYGFYSRLRFANPLTLPELAKYVDGHPACVAILQKDQEKEIRTDGRFALDVLHEQTIGSRRMLLAKLTKVPGPLWDKAKSLLAPGGPPSSPDRSTSP